MHGAASLSPYFFLEVSGARIVSAGGLSCPEEFLTFLARALCVGNIVTTFAEPFRGR